jgi:hypothetical protein
VTTPPFAFPSAFEVYEPTPEEIAAHERALVQPDGDEDEELHELVDEPDLGAVIPKETVVPIEPDAPWHATLYNNVKATHTGRAVSWSVYRMLAHRPLVVDELDVVEAMGESATQVKSELQYACLHASAGYRNALHVRGSCGFQIDLEGCPEADVEAELAALQYVDLIHPSASHWLRLSTGEFRVRATIRTSRWITEDERHWIFDKWIAPRAPHADRAMRSSVQGSVIPAVSRTNREAWWCVETGAVMPVDLVLDETGPAPKGYAKQSGGSMSAPIERVPTHPMPADQRMAMFVRALADLEKCPPRSATTGGTLKGSHGFPWVQRIARDAVNFGVPFADALAVATERADASWQPREVAEAFVGAWRYIDRSSRWESRLPPMDGPLAERITPSGDVAERIATFAGGMLFVKAGMGSGKTEGAARLCLANPTWRVLFVTSRQRSAKEAARRAGLEFYQNASPTSSRVAVCINSLGKFALTRDAKGKEVLREWDLVVIDETPEVVDAIFKLCREPPQKMLKLLVNTFVRARNSIALSADLREWHVALFTKPDAETTLAHERIESAEVLPRHAYVMPCSECEVATWDAIVEAHAAGDGRKVVVQSSSKATLDRFARMIAAELPSVRVFSLTRHTDPNAVENFDETVREHDVIMTNTAGGSALSCHVPIWRQFVLLDNNAIGGHAIGQLIGRFRVFSDDGMLVVGERVQRGTSLSIDADEVETELQGRCERGEWTDDVHWDGKAWRWDYLPAKTALVHLMIDARAQRSDPTFAAEAERRGWTLEHVEYQDPETDVATFTATMRRLKKELRDEQIAAIVQAPDMTEAEYRKTAATEYTRTPEAEARIARHLIQREILGDAEAPPPDPTDWRATMAWSCKHARRSVVDDDLARRWHDGAYAGQIRRWCLTLARAYAPKVGQAAELDERERNDHDAARASGETHEARLLVLLLRECFGLAPGDDPGTRTVPVGRPRKDGSHKHWRTIPAGVDVSTLRARVLAFYREHRAALQAAGWGDFAAPTEDTAIGWLGDRLRGRIAVGLTRRGKGDDRTYSPAWPPVPHWTPTWLRMEARAEARAALQSHARAGAAPEAGAEKGPTKTNTRSPSGPERGTFSAPLPSA